VNLSLLFPGKALKGPEADLVKTYLTRAKHYADITLTYLPEPHGKLPLRALDKALLKRPRLVSLDVKGKSYSTESFAKSLEKNASRPTAFIIGASFGLSQDILEASDELLSLSTFTLPHRLALVVLSEQLYRSLSFLSGHPYHHQD